FQTHGDQLNDVEVTRGRALVAGGDAGLRILDVDHPAAIREIGALDTPDEVIDLEVRGRRASLLDCFSDRARLRLVDIARPSAPVEIGSLDLPAAAQDIALKGPLVLVADRDSGLIAIDAKDPANPVEIGSLPGGAEAVEVANHLAYVAAGPG